MYYFILFSYLTARVLNEFFSSCLAIRNPAVMTRLHVQLHSSCAALVRS